MKIGQPPSEDPVEALPQSVPPAHSRPPPTHTSTRDSWTLRRKSLTGSLLLSPGSWCAQGFVCALQESTSPVLWKFYNQNPLASKSNSLGVLSPFARSPGWEICCVYNCSAVCGSSAQRLCGRVSGDLLQKGLCHMLWPRSPAPRAPAPAAGHCWPVPP